MNTLVVLLLTSCAPAQYPAMQSPSSIPMNSYGSATDAGWSGQSQDSRPRFFSRIRSFFRRQNDSSMSNPYYGGSFSSNGNSGSMMNGSYSGIPSSSGGGFITSGPNTGRYVSPSMTGTGSFTNPGMVNGNFVPSPMPANSVITIPGRTTSIGAEPITPVPSTAPAQRMPTGNAGDSF